MTSLTIPSPISHKETCDFIPTTLGWVGLENPGNKEEMFPPRDTAKVTLNCEQQLLSIHSESFLTADQERSEGLEELLAGINPLCHHQEAGVLHSRCSA